MELELFILLVMVLIPFSISIISLILSVKKEEEVNKALYLSLPFMIYLIFTWFLIWGLTDGGDIWKELGTTNLERLVNYLQTYWFFSPFVSLFFSSIIAIISFCYAYINKKKNRIWWNVSGVISLLSLLTLPTGFFYIDPIVRPLIVIWFIGKKIKGKLKERL